jgi:hypothetical protein
VNPVVLQDELQTQLTEQFFVALQPWQGLSELIEMPVVQVKQVGHHAVMTFKLPGYPV